jgi:hypothetical protein
MVATKGLGDRRATVRFDVGGGLWGTLETMEPLPMRNIGPGGVLVESPAPLELESTHSIQLLLPGHESMADVRVRHVTSIHDMAKGSRYLIGLEFLALEDSAVMEIDQLVARGGVPPSGSEVV